MYLYYPHAPILLRVVRHVRRSAKADGGYRWEGGGRQGWLTNTEAERAIKSELLIVMSDEDAKLLAPRLRDIRAARMAYSSNLTRHARLTAVPPSTPRRIKK